MDSPQFPQSLDLAWQNWKFETLHSHSRSVAVAAGWNSSLNTRGEVHLLQILIGIHSGPSQPWKDIDRMIQWTTKELRQFQLA